ncbi:hypothetical protein AA13595_0776 [Gluconacetobacter johannae DSM 13595]|nr:hypothetical protein AA13595_0776 [Gluconacetobacter johannae DSM 13595]
MLIPIVMEKPPLLPYMKSVACSDTGDIQPTIGPPSGGIVCGVLAGPICTPYPSFIVISLSAIGQHLQIARQDLHAAKRIARLLLRRAME